MFEVVVYREDKSVAERWQASSLEEARHTMASRLREYRDEYISIADPRYRVVVLKDGEEVGSEWTHSRMPWVF